MPQPNTKLDFNRTPPTVWNQVISLRLVEQCGWLGLGLGLPSDIIALGGAMWNGSTDEGIEKSILKQQQQQI